MFGQDRDGLRRAWVDAWSKRRDGRPLEPLEAQLADVIELHPEYHALLQSGDQVLADEWTPERGESNPFLHMGLHLALREQVATDRPAGIKAVYGQLAARLGDAHDAEHRMIDCLAEALWQAQRDGQPPDEAAYLERLRGL